MKLTFKTLYRLADKQRYKWFIIFVDYSKSTDMYAHSFTIDTKDCEALMPILDSQLEIEDIVDKGNVLEIGTK